MKWLDSLHGHHHHTRRLRVLGETMADLIPEGASVLDVGCGDGLLTHYLGELRRDIEVSGVDVLVRKGALIPVREFDGHSLPYSDGAFDVVMLVDVVHHAGDPLQLLREAARVARRWLILKDHTLTGWLARPTLTFMDRTSNQRHGVDLPFHYWERRRWSEAFSILGLEIELWKTDLELYPWWLSWLFERSLHFAARLRVS